MYIRRNFMSLARDKYKNLLYVHENNITTKIKNNYKNKGEVIEGFYHNNYIPMRDLVLNLKFEDNMSIFNEAAEIFNNYYDKLVYFAKKEKISSQSKWASTFLEELSNYLFKDIPEILSGEYGIFNKKIYAGLKIDNDKSIKIITKDVDFCIGKKVNISINGQKELDLILPIIAVEVKTYLDATMFGEVKSSSKSIRSASPNSKTYVLMGYKEIADEHIIAARQDTTLTEIFVLKADEDKPIHYEALYEYWKEIKYAVENIVIDETIFVPGRILNPKKENI
jgi:hypothetical protein